MEVCATPSWHVSIALAGLFACWSPAPGNVQPVIDGLEPVTAGHDPTQKHELPPVASPPEEAPPPDGESFDPTADPRGGPCDACDANCDALHDLADVALFIDALLTDEPACSPCAADLDESGAVDGKDLQPFVDCLLAPPAAGACCLDGTTCVIATELDCGGLWFGPDSQCSSNVCDIADLKAYRPQYGAGYFPQVKTAVPDALEADALLGPGIRINAPGDFDPAGEDDLIEVQLDTTVPGAALVLRRSHPALHIWTTRTKQAGTEIVFNGDRTGALPLAPGQSLLTLWVEWGEAAHGEADLHVEPFAVAVSLDVLRIHTFRSIVLALGGEDQSPTTPVDANHGTFVVAHALYQQGYDVHIYDEDNVGADGGGAALVEAVEAVSQRLADQIAIFGYSHGGGSTHDLAERLDNDRAGIGIFEILVTSYVDAVENDSDFDISQELRRPPSTAYHANHYQVGSLGDFFLDGGPVPDSDPTPTGLNVETTAWGAGATHFQVDDFVQVRTFIQTNLQSRMSR